MSKAELLELEEKIMKYMVEVAEDQVIDTNEIVNLAMYAREITNKID